MSAEFRVVWEREPYQHVGVPASRPARRYSQHYASLAAAQRKAMRLQGRIAESKGHDPDEFICCDGGDYYPRDHECKTWGEWEAETTAEWEPLRMLRIECREVRDWEQIKTLTVDSAA